MPRKIIIELSKEENELFKWFKKYQGVWQLAKKLKPGRVVLHFNPSGKLKKKEIHDYTPEKDKK